MSAFEFLFSRPSVAYLFPGQGSQSVGMGRELAEQYPAAREAFEEANDTLGFALSELCFYGPEEALTDTVNAQPALMAVSMAAMRALESEIGPMFLDVERSDGPIFAAGHSMGEYSALVAAGALGYADGLKLVRERGRLMKEAGTLRPGMMAAILGLDEPQVEAVCAACRAQGGIVQVANDNCPGQTVISGDRAGMECAMAALEKAGARKVVPLAVSIASHSPLMEPAAAGLRAAINNAPINAPEIPVIGNTTAAVLTDPAAIREELTAQLTGRVRWTESMRIALERGVTDFVEIGAGQVLTGLVKRVDRKAGRHTVNDPATVEAFIEWLAESSLQC